MATAEHPVIPFLVPAPDALNEWIEANAPPDIALLWRIIRTDYENMARALDGLVPSTTADGLGQVWRRVGEEQ